ncbi:protein phosphatase 2C domain-containing protein [Roseibacillus ishigakijimensis]|uniref:Protein phosphatase 2C domain-containing protein n=1 Tax=Roseibacillus ishigakijimensis TaxID=454146 RepID=A0A934VLV5_9BACT|nr:protein phosphatase 2C domain-containing protein [Roseibacillus ishigakijimensis]MBK1833476.1 protein phosphatase 2C domain-containing protein [Roseibacillus ishigakijimensis]
MRELKDGIRSKVKLDFQGRVHKWFRGTDADKRYENEIFVLKTLEERGCPYVPQVLEEHPEELYFVSTNCGAPADGISKTKADALFHELEHEYGVRHDDPEPRNVTYNNRQGRFNLIDFELATVLSEEEMAAEEDHGFSGVVRAVWAAASRQGKTHKANDDYWLALQIHPDGTTNATEDGELLLDPEHLVLAVSDGMGGNAAGELASRLVINWIRKHASQLYATAQDDELMGKRLRSLIDDAHAGINEIANQDQEHLKGMGATLSLVYLAPGKLHYAHIGDSRIYLHEPESRQPPRALTNDHTYAWRDWKAGKITEIKYRMHPRRSVLYDVMGANHAKIHPDIGSLNLSLPARLLLCTDGISDGFWEKHFTAALESDKEARELRDEVLEKAYRLAGKDDTTLIVADIDNPHA